MKKEKISFITIALFVIVGFIFLLPLCACQRKTTTKKITTIVKTTKTNPLAHFYYGDREIVWYVFYNNQNELHWVVKTTEGKVIEGKGYKITNSNYCFTDETGSHLELTYEAYQYVLTIVK